MNKFLTCISVLCILAITYSSSPTWKLSSTFINLDSSQILMAKENFFVYQQLNSIVRYDTKTNTESIISPTFTCPLNAWFFFSTNESYFCLFESNSGEVLRQIDIKTGQAIQSIALPTGYFQQESINGNYLVGFTTQDSIFSLLTLNYTCSVNFIPYVSNIVFVTATPSHAVILGVNQTSTNTVVISFYNCESGTYFANQTWNFELNQAMGYSFLNNSYDLVVMKGYSESVVWLLLYQNGTLHDSVDFFQQKGKIHFKPVNDSQFMLAVNNGEENNIDVYQIEIAHSNFLINYKTHTNLPFTIQSSGQGYSEELYTFTTPSIAINFNFSSFTIQSLSNQVYPSLQFSNGSVVDLDLGGYFLTQPNGEILSMTTLMATGIYSIQAEPNITYGFNSGCEVNGSQCQLTIFNASNSSIITIPFTNCPCSEGGDQNNSVVSVTRSKDGGDYFVAYFNSENNYLMYAYGNVGSSFQLSKMRNIYSFFVNSSSMEVNVLVQDTSTFKLQTYSLDNGTILGNTLILKSTIFEAQTVKLDENTFSFGLVTDLTDGIVFVYQISTNTNISVTNLPGFANIIPLGVTKPPGNWNITVNGFAFLGLNGQTCIANVNGETSCIGLLLSTGPVYEGVNSFAVNTEGFFPKQLVYEVTNWGLTTLEKKNFRGKVIEDI